MKITYQDYRYILNLQKPEIPSHRLLDYRVDIDEKRCTVKAFVPYWLYIVLFIPCHLAQAICLLWDGGLKEFEFNPRQITSLSYLNWDEPYLKVKEVLDKSKRK